MNSNDNPTVDQVQPSAVPVDPDPQVQSTPHVTAPKEPGEIGWPANATEPGDPSLPTAGYDPGHVLDDVAEAGSAAAPDASLQALKDAKADDSTGAAVETTDKKDQAKFSKP